MLQALQHSAVSGLIVGLVYGLVSLRCKNHALGRQEVRLRAIVDASPTLIFVKDTDGRYLLINRSYESTFHVSREQVIGKTDHDIFPRTVAEAVRTNDQLVITDGQTLEFEGVAPKENGPQTYYTIKSPLRCSSGKIYAVCGMSTNITGRIQAEEAFRQAHSELEQRVEERTTALATANTQLQQEIKERESVVGDLRESEERFALAMRGTSNGLWDWDIQTNVVYYAPHFKEIFGYAEHEVEHTFAFFKSHLHPDDHDRVLQEIKNHLQRRTSFDIEYRLRTKYGRYVWIQARGQALWHADGHPIRMAGSIRDITERKEIEKQLREGANVLAASSAKIVGALTQFLASTTETATAITQTSTTVEEVKQTAAIAGQHAQRVSSSAQHTATISQAGEQAVTHAVTGLHRAREQMESIAQSVVKLGEQSQTIGDIISSVSTLAEQSNLLAVNAAIKATKAGEHGRGFAVVAQEVKALAQQSKQAATQVRTILNEIQKAANVAVLVTEQGTKAVEVGVSQSIEANQSIRALSQGMGEAAQAVTQIVVPSQQQQIGLDQVATAISQLKLATQQNVDGIRQIEAAVHQLHGLGHTLKSLVERYTTVPAHGNDTDDAASVPLTQATQTLSPTGSPQRFAS